MQRRNTIFLALILSLSLGGCSSKEQKTVNDPTVPQSENTTAPVSAATKKEDKGNASPFKDWNENTKVARMGDPFFGDGPIYDVKQPVTSVLSVNDVHEDSGVVYVFYGNRENPYVSIAKNGKWIHKSVAVKYNDWNIAGNGFFDIENDKDLFRVNIDESGKTDKLLIKTGQFDHHSEIVKTDKGKAFIVRDRSINNSDTYNLLVTTKGEQIKLDLEFLKDETGRLNYVDTQSKNVYFNSGENQQTLTVYNYEKKEKLKEIKLANRYFIDVNQLNDDSLLLVAFDENADATVQAVSKLLAPISKEVKFNYDSNNHDFIVTKTKNELHFWKDALFDDNKNPTSQIVYYSALKY